MNTFKQVNKIISVLVLSLVFTASSYPYSFKSQDVLRLPINNIDKNRIDKAGSEFSTQQGASMLRRSFLSLIPGVGMLSAQTTIPNIDIRVQQAIRGIQTVINIARARGMSIDLTNLVCSDKEIEGYLRYAFGMLKSEEIVKSVFTNKAALKSLMNLAEEDYYYSMFIILHQLSMDTRYAVQISNALSELGRETATTQGKLAEDFSQKIVVLKEARERVLKEKAIPERRAAEIELTYGQRIVNWLMYIVDVLYKGRTGLSRSLVKAFNVPGNDPQVYKEAVNDSMRMILQEGVSGYDGGASEMVLAHTGSIDQARKFVDAYWSGATYQLRSICANWGGRTDFERPFNFYDRDPTVIARDNSGRGRRGWPFKLISEFYIVTLPDGRQATWDQFQPIWGEAAWTGMGALQVDAKQHGKENVVSKNDTGIQLAKEIVRAAMILQKDKENAGAVLERGAAVPVPMAPRGTYHENDPEQRNPFNMKWLNDEVSVENNLSGFALYRMLLELDPNHQVEIDGQRLRLSEYKDKVEKFLLWAYDPVKHEFCQGAHFNGKEWIKNTVYATDVQLWAVLVLGADWLDSRFGAGETFKMLERTVQQGGVMNVQGKLIGFDYSNQKRNRSAEWSLFEPALRKAATYYRIKLDRDRGNADLRTWQAELMRWSGEIRTGIQDLKKVSPDGTMISWRYADRPIQSIEHGWFTPPGKDTEHTAAACWDALANYKGPQGRGFFNPFVLGGDVGNVDELPIPRIDPRPIPRPSPPGHRSMIIGGPPAALQSL